MPSAIDDEQPRQRRIEPPGEEIVEQGLDDDSVLRRPLDHGQDMLVAVAIDADAATKTWSPTCRPSIWMTSRSSSERSEASQAFIFLRTAPQKRRETADFEVPSHHALSPGRPRADGPRGGTWGRDHQVERPLEQGCHRVAPANCILVARSANPWPGRRGSRSRYVSSPAITSTVPMAAMSERTSVWRPPPSSRPRRGEPDTKPIHAEMDCVAVRYRIEGARAGRLELRILFLHGVVPLSGRLQHGA